MESSVAVGGHGGGLPLQGPGGRKEWRVVNESSGRERVVGDGPGSQARLSPAGRLRPNAGASRRSSRNGQMFHPSGSGHSSDSDHHGGDIGVAHLMPPSLATQELMPQDIGQGDEAVLYEEASRREGWLSLSKDHVFQMHRAQHRNEHFDSALSSMSLDPGLTSMENPDEALQQRLHDVSRQREHFQQVELELRAQFIARSEVIRLQNSFDDQSKQHSEIVSSLQGQIQDREQQIRHLEQQIEERERQLHVNQMETNEAVWAKDGLLREQTSELATLRRDRDSAVNEHQVAAAQLDAERAEHAAQLENLKDQVREKDRQLQDTEEQSRHNQDLIIYKDEQLREAQTWMARAQELDAFHINTNNSLHAELRDKTEQINQLWLGYQRQLADVDRYHTQMSQRLQQELSDAREQIGALKGPGGSDRHYIDERPSVSDGKEAKGFDANDDSGIKGNRILMAVSPALNQTKPKVTPNGDIMNIGNIEGLLPVLLPRDGLPAKVEHAPGIPVVPGPPLLGITPVLPSSGPTSGIHQFGMHQQGMPPTLQPSPLQIPQPALAPLQPIAAVLGPQQHHPPLQHQQVLHHHHHHNPQHHQSLQVQGPSQRLQTQAVHDQNAQAPQPQHLLQTSLQSQGQQMRHQEIRLQEQPEQTVNDQSLMKSQQEGARFSQGSSVTQKHSHNEGMHQHQQHQQQQMDSQLFHQQKQSQPTFPEQKDILSVVQKPRQEEKHMLPSDLQQMRIGEGHQDSESTLQHRQQNAQQERQSLEHRKTDPRLQQFSNQEVKQQQGGQAHQRLHQGNGESQTQHLQHQQGITGSMARLGISSRSSSSISQDVSVSSDKPHEVSVNVSTPDNPEFQMSTAQVAKQQKYTEGNNNRSAEPVLLDERSLLACLVRAVPADRTSRIRISTTLPNRLGKMLAPLHWHDYRKQYGRLDDFVGSHPELFAIEGDLIHLQEGAHATISQTTATAKAAAAVAAVNAPGQPRAPTVAVTPVAQPPQKGRNSSKSQHISAHKESRSGAVTMVEAGNQPQLSSQTGHTRQSQISAINRTGGDNGLVNVHHSGINQASSTMKNEGKAEGMNRGQGMGTISNGMSTHDDENSANLENGASNGFGNNEKAGGLYAGKQQGRGSLHGSGRYRKQENHVRPQTQDGRTAGPASSSQ